MQSRIAKSSLMDTPWTLVFARYGSSRNSFGSLQTKALNERGQEQLQFCKNFISSKKHKIGPRLLLIITG